MIDENKDYDSQDDIETTGEDNMVEPELEEVETRSTDTVKKLKDKLKRSEAEKRQHLEDLQRAKAEFLNAKRRLEDDRVRDKERLINEHIEKLLPLCDSFYMAMNNKEAWESIDATWRTGVESINNQLQSILRDYQVRIVDAEGAPFDPTIHEAMTNVPVQDEAQHHKVLSVIQNGYIRTTQNGDQLIRPARVTVGEYTE